MIQYDPNLLKRTDGPYHNASYVDLGYGAEPFTTLESAARLRHLNPALPVLGVEIDPERVEVAKPYEDDLTCFRLGGFNIPLQAGEHLRLVRAFNVLRQYQEEEVQPAWELIGESLLPGGLLIEGTSDPFGRIWVANLLRKLGDGSLRLEALAFGTNFRWGFDPAIFQPVLPKNLIHRMLPGQPIFDFISAWKDSAHETIGHKQYGLRQWFCTSAERLAARGYRIDTRKKMLQRGYLVWREPVLGF